MNRTIALLLTGALLSAVCLAQSSTDMQTGAAAAQDTSVSANKSGVQAGSNSSATAAQETTVSGKNGQAQAATAGQLQAGSTVQAELTKPVDARKNKRGDEVVAKTTQDMKSNGQTVLPKGSKLVGHITEVQAREKGQQESHMGIAFEHAILKNGTQVPMALTLQAIGSSQTNAAAAMDDSEMAGSTMAGSTMAGENLSGMASASGPGATRGALGGVTSTTRQAVNTAGAATGGTVQAAHSAGAGVAGGLNSTSRGVVGLHGLNLAPATTSSANAGSVISSSTNNVHLDSGTQMILSAGGQ
jgi:hypothetical protein